jgi:starch phosphorylase
MEIALDAEIPTYAGGLGVLAGDTLRTSADLELPMVGVSLLSRMGYFRQTLDTDGTQGELPQPWSPEQWLVPLNAKIAVPIAERNVWVQAWLYILQGERERNIPVIFLDTDLTENHSEDREITHYLYGKDEKYRLTQEIILGIGGARILNALGFRIHKYHMNEGHSALLGLELLRRYERDPDQVGPGDSVYDVSEVKRRCLFTTHTPVESGHDKFSYGLVQELLNDFMDLNELRLLAGNEHLNMTRLALNLSGYVNGVAKLHAQVSNSMFPGYRVHAITNGVHPATWVAPAIAALYDTHFTDWRHDPEILVRADQLDDNELWAAHLAAKQQLVNTVLTLRNVELDLNTPILGFARRMTGYKRPDMLFRDLNRLEKIAQRYPLQIVLAGKAHPNDQSGKRLVQKIHKYIEDLAPSVRVVFLQEYNTELARFLVSGSDVWVNTPLRPFEASGTSGMKAALNGVPNLSVLDGWWIEGCIEGITGWAVGDGSSPVDNGAELESLYEKLETIVLPMFYKDRPGWLEVMKGAIAKNGSYFNSHRMMRRYAAEAYFR